LLIAGSYLIITYMEKINLPKPSEKSKTSVEEALLKRRSIRRFKDEPLKMAEVSQLLWAATGVTDKKGRTTVPSAGGTYPLQAYLVAGNTAGIPAGIYKYERFDNTLAPVVEGDKRLDLANASLYQSSVNEASISIVLTAFYERTTSRYGDRGFRYVHMEAGHCAQNVALQAVGLNLGTVMVGAFNDLDLKKTMALSATEEPLYIIPVGKPKK